MEDIIITEAVRNAIEMLNDAGINVAAIGGRFYMFEFFEPATNNVHMHVVQGRDITKFLSTGSQFLNTSITEAAVSQLTTELLDIRSRTRHYSVLHPWVTFQRGR